MSTTTLLVLLLIWGLNALIVLAIPFSILVALYVVAGVIWRGVK